MNAILREELTHEPAPSGRRLYEVISDWERPPAVERRRGYMVLTKADSTSDSPPLHFSDHKLSSNI